MSDSTAQSDENTDPLEAPKSRVKAAAAEMRGAAADAARDVKDRAGVMAEELRGKAGDLHKDLESYVRENPTQSILAALGVGLVVGLIFRR